MLENTSVWQTYVADGVQKQWSFTLPYVEDSEIKLYISHEGVFEEVDPTLYTFNRETNVLTYPIGESPAAPAGDIIALWRETDLTQEEDSSHVAFKSNDVERMVDKLTAICQEIHDQQSRSISYNPAESSTGDITDATSYIHLLEGYKDSAEEAASNSETWAEGTDEQVAPLGGDHSAKWWANIAQEAAESETVQTVADNIADVNTVAGISSDVTSVASISSAVSTVASNNTDIDTVATNISSVNTAATNMAAIIAAPTAATSASTSATNAEIWAEGTDQQVTPLGGEKSAKGWADVAEGWIKVIFRDWTGD